MLRRDATPRGTLRKSCNSLLYQEERRSKSERDLRVDARVIVMPSVFRVSLAATEEATGMLLVCIFHDACALKFFQLFGSSKRCDGGIKGNFENFAPFRK